MFQTIYLGKLSGIKIYIHWTFWLLAIYVLVSNLDQGLSNALYSLGFVFAVFGCVFLHEMGHALAGRWFRIPTVDITLLPIGGLARMGEFPRAPFAELIVAIAGPMVNVVIAMSLLLGLSIQASFTRMTEAGIGSLNPAEQLLLANVALAVFNMLPSFPMDGGRVLRSLLAMFLPYESATRYAARVGQIMAIAMFIASFYVGFSLMLIAIMVFVVCTGELIKQNLIVMTNKMSDGFPATVGPFDSAGPEAPTSGDVVDAVEVRQVR